jgi:hypothetical protein
MKILEVVLELFLHAEGREDDRQKNTHTAKLTTTILQVFFANGARN